MIIKDFYSARNDGVDLYKTYSDNGVMIKKKGTNEIYAEAIDVEGAPFEYEETETPIEYEETETPIEYEETETPIETEKE